jgi:ABC-type branched-subunit amino acid transport system substrate-binding protein
MTAFVPGLSETDPKKLILSLQQLAAGRSNATGTVTLTVSATSTTVTDQNCAAGSAIVLTPQTANAAAALATTYVSTANGSFVITHSSNTQADRTFAYAIQG